MKIILQELTPYPKSIKWKIHNNYFKKKGADAWKKGEVPCDITCNSRAAFQNARVVFEALEAKYGKKRIAATTKINVLEIGSGLGAFAIHFIQNFEDICKKYKRTYHKHLHYLFTDYSKKNVEEASKNKHLASLKKKGVLDFYIFDATQPDHVVKLGTKKKVSLTRKKLSAVVANYVYCVLPLTVIRKKHGKMYEKWVSLHYTSRSRIKDTKQFIHDMTYKPTEQTYLTSLVEKHHYKPISLKKLCRDKLHLATVEEELMDFDIATTLYPRSLMDHLTDIKKVLTSHGVILISDKGYASSDYCYGEHECEPSIHGNSFAHSVHFPMLERFANKIGFSSIRTKDETKSLQTMALFNNEELPKKVKSSFTKQFISSNLNHAVYTLNETAHEYQSDGNQEKAIKYIKMCQNIRPYDARYYYDLANIYMDENNYEKAMGQLKLAKKYDYFNQYDVDFNLGRGYYYLGIYKKAIECYETSIKDSGENEYAYYNIGLCLEEIHDLEAAKHSYKQAIRVNKHYDLAHERLNDLEVYC